MPSTPIKVGRKKLSLSNLDKVLYPQAGFTKGQVIDYYLRISPVLLPHLKGRPLTLKRYPNGVDGMFFYEKRCPSHRPGWMPTAKVWSERSGDHLLFCVAQNVEALVWIANLASIELHTLLATTKDLDRPTMVAFDLDPGPPADMLDCIRVARRMRGIFDHLGLQSFPKTSGGKGLHLYVPLNTKTTFDQTKRFAHALAMLLERDDPKRVVSKMRKDLRQGKVLVDWSQNDEHKTTVSVYSLRARLRPMVSAPVTWEELEQAERKRDLRRLVFETDDVLRRVEKLGDLFVRVLTIKQTLPKAKSIT